MLPPVSLVRRHDTHRLIPSKHARPAESVLARVADSDAHLQDLFDLDLATNDRLLAENRLLPGIGPHELVFGVPYYAIVNAAFCHAHPLGSRFNGPDRGAWYAAFELPTARHEVAFHKAVELAETDWWQESVTYDDYLADFSAAFHDLRGAARFAGCLAPDSYTASQRLAERLLAAESMGVVYPSVRRRGGTCVACFRPPLVMHVRKADTWRFTWTRPGPPTVERVGPGRRARRTP
ncbi:MAG: RES family NAD+ phosphorylase [Bacteroidales bacterium]